jgi:hypothetical protein
MSRAEPINAAAEERVIQTWHDYVRYLEAHQQLLDLRTAARGATFEHDDSPEQREAAARAVLGAIPSADRAAFDAALERERQDVQADLEAERKESGSGMPLDPDYVERTALAQLHDEAHGTGTEEGEGWVPFGPREEDWLRVDVRALQGAPSAKAYLLRTNTRNERRRNVVLAIGILLGALVSLAGWYLWSSGAATTIVALQQPTVNDATVEPWVPRSVQVVSISTTLTLPVRAVGGVWPPEFSAADQAGWHPASVLPLQLCVPAGVLETASVLRVRGGGTVPYRIYTLQTQPLDAPDLELVACSDEATSQVRYGRLQQVEPLPDQPLGDAVVVANQPLRVEQVTVIGLGDDPDLPPAQARVTITVAVTNAVDWPSWAPTLLLRDGQALLPSDRVATATGMEFAYLVPLPSETQTVVWQLSPPDGSAAARWRSTISPPPSRTEVLAERLGVEDVRVVEARSSVVEVEVVLHNHSDAPLPLRPNDFVVTTDDAPVALPDLAALATPLAPQETRSLRIELPRPTADGPLILAIGRERWQIEAL